MQYKVPQNVQREDTIVGPITFKQLIILFAGGGLTYMIYSALAVRYYWEVWLWPVIIGSSLTLAFAFLKINDRNFHVYLLNLTEHILLARKRVWKQGSGETFISPFSKIYVKKIEEEVVQKKEIQEEKIEDILKALESPSKIKKQ